jgi:hypothetical protein
MAMIKIEDEGGEDVSEPGNQFNIFKNWAKKKRKEKKRKKKKSRNQESCFENSWECMLNPGKDDT